MEPRERSIEKTQRALHARRRLLIAAAATTTMPPSTRSSTSNALSTYCSSASASTAPAPERGAVAGATQYASEDLMLDGDDWLCQTLLPSASKVGNPRPLRAPPEPARRS